MADKIIVVEQNLKQIKIYYASNNVRRLRYGLAARRSSFNRMRVLERQKSRRKKKEKIYPFWIVDEFSNIFPSRSRRYIGMPDYIKQSSKAAPDFAAVPYDFDTRKNALVKVE